MSDVPPGWYPLPNGTQRYWDGSSWTNLPAPDDLDESEDAPVPSELDADAPASPEPAADAPATTLTRTGKRKKTVLIAVAAVVLVLLGSGAVVWKVTADNAAAQVAADEKAAADAKAAEEKRAADLQAAADTAERESRARSVTEIEKSVTSMAEGHATDGFIDGPIIDTSCVPTGGGSTDDLTELTTVFECFVANKDNGDGTMSGYYYNATMNWTTGSYTYGMGRP